VILKTDDYDERVRELVRKREIRERLKWKREKKIERVVKQQNEGEMIKQR